jgi:hypothetical protein
MNNALFLRGRFGEWDDTGRQSIVSMNVAFAAARRVGLAMVEDIFLGVDHVLQTNTVSSPRIV